MDEHGFQRLVCSHLLDGFAMIAVIGFAGWLLWGLILGDLEKT